MTNRDLKATPTSVARRRAAGTVKVSISQKIVPRLPHEHDESADPTTGEVREVIEQAADDLKRGLTDTDRGAQMTKVYKSL